MLCVKCLIPCVCRLLRRLATLLSQQASLMASNEAFRKQAEGASTAAKKYMEENELLQEVGHAHTHTHTHTHRNRKLLKNKVECLAATDTEFIWTENYQVTSDLKLLEVEIHTWSRVSCRNQLLKVKKHVSAVNVGKTISYCGFNVSSVSYKTHMSCQQDSRNKK